ncbi:MFS transporter [[Eubacterium] cellulosolvens]
MKNPLVISITHMFVEFFLLTQVALIPVYVKEFQLSLLQVSVVASIFPLIYLTANIPCGLLADRFNARFILSGAMMIEGVSALVISQTNSFYILLLMLALNGLSSPLYHTTGVSQISLLSNRSEVNKSMGLHNAFGVLGAVIGLGCLSVFLSTAGWRWAFLTLSFPILLWGVLILLFSQFKMISSSRGEYSLKIGSIVNIFSRKFLLFLFSTRLELVGFYAISTFMTTYFVSAVGFSVATSTSIFSLGVFVGIFGSLAGGYFSGKFNVKNALNFIVLICIVALLAMGLTRRPVLSASLYLVYAFFSYSFWAPLNIVVADLTPLRERGLGYSINFFTEGLAWTFTPIVAALVISSFSLSYLIPFCIIFLAGGLIMCQFLRYSYAESRFS